MRIALVRCAVPLLLAGCGGGGGGGDAGDVAGDDPAGDPEHETGSECETAGGSCTDGALCPAGHEPIDPGPHRDCPGNYEMPGWCCVEAPASSCSDSEEGNCIVGDTCPGSECLAPEPTGLECEAGRVCCIQMGCA